VQYPNFLEVWEPNPLGPIIGMADVVPPHGAFATYLTDPGHPDPPVSESIYINLFGVNVKDYVLGKSSTENTGG
jgi:hypothetical protein